MTNPFTNSEDQEYDQPIIGRTLKQSLIHYWYFIVAIIVAVAFYGKWGMFTYDAAVFFAACLVVANWVFNSFWYDLKNRTPKLVCNPISTTTTGNYINAGNYVIFRMGEIDARSVKFAGKEGVIIVPKTACYKIGRNVYLPVRVQNVRFEELPIEVKKNIIDYNLKKPYLFGIADEDSFLTMPDLTKVLEEIKNMNGHISMQEKIIKKTRDQIQSYHSSTSRIKRIISNKIFDNNPKREDDW